MNVDPRASVDVPEEALDIAARMFAGLGYDSTAVEMIVCAGVDPDVVAAAGGKAGLYEAVMKRAHEDILDVLEPAISQLTPDAAGVKRIADAFLDFSLQNPQVGALWLHRSLADAADISHLESRYLAEVYDRITNVLHAVVSPDLDLQLAILTVEWCVYGFVRGGVLDDKARRVNPYDSAVHRRFRKYLHYLVDAMLEDGHSRPIPTG